MSTIEESALGAGMLFDPTSPLVPTGNLRRREYVSRAVEGVSVLAATVAVIMMGLIVFSVIQRGAPVLSADFVVQNFQGYSTGGILNYLLGTLELVAIGAAIAIPLGVLTALYLTEFSRANSRSGRVLKVVLEMMQGLPTIVVGLFVVGLLVLPAHKQFGLAGSIALAIIMFPLIARSSQEVLLLVPGSLREAADALGVSRWRGVLTVILPAATAGIVTGAILAVARAAGETAPLLVADGIFNPNTITVNPLHGVPSVPMYIFTIYDLAIPNAVSRAWGAAFLLMAFILLANIGARVLLARSRRRKGL